MKRVIARKNLFKNSIPIVSHLSSRGEEVIKKASLSEEVSARFNKLPTKSNTQYIILFYHKEENVVIVLKSRYNKSSKEV